MSTPENNISFAGSTHYRVSLWGSTGAAAAPARTSDNVLIRQRSPIYRQLSIDDKFRILADAWKLDSQLLSSTNEMASLDSYKRIIEMGQRVLPLILREVEHDPDYWFIALERISGANPVTNEERGRLGLMADAWLRWGREQGLI